MKKLISIAALVLVSSFLNLANAQVKDEVKTDAKKVGNKTAEVASKAKAKVTDKEYKDKVGPDGQKIYINGHSKYYWIDKKGAKHFVAAAALKDK